MNRLLKKKKKGAKGKKKDKKKSTGLFSEKKKETKNDDAWGDDDEGFIIDYSVKEKTANDNDKPAAINLESGWKEEEIVVKPEEEEKEPEPKKKVIKWGDAVRENKNYEQTMADNYFPELGDQAAVSNKKKKKNTTTQGDGEEGFKPRKFFNSAGGVNNNLKKLMTRGPMPEAPVEEKRIDDDGNKILNVKGKVSLKYQKTQAEIMQEKMLKEIEEREAKQRAENPPPEKKRLFGNGGRGFGGGDRGGFKRGDRDRDFGRGDRDRDRDFGRGDRGRDRDFGRGDRDRDFGRGGDRDRDRDRDFKRDDNLGGAVLTRGAGKSLALGEGNSGEKKPGRGFGGGGFRSGEKREWNEPRDRDRDRGGDWGRNRDRDRDRRDDRGGDWGRDRDKASSKFESGITLTRGSGKVKGLGSGNKGSAGKELSRGSASKQLGKGREVKPVRLERGPAKTVGKVIAATWD